MVELQRVTFAEALVPLLPEEFRLPETAAWRDTLSQALDSEGVRALVIDAGLTWPDW